jgi:hypothetical protein
MMDPQSRSHRFRASGIAAHVRAGAAAFPCQLEELSADGAFLRTDRPVEVGTALEVDLVKPGARKALQLRAVVLRAIPGRDGHQPGLDVEFRLVDSEDFQRLVSWLEEMKTRGSKPPAHATTSASATAPITAPIPTSPIATAPIREKAEDERSKLMLQIKGLLLELDELRDRLHNRDIEVDDLRRRLATAEQLLGSQRPRE